MNHTELKYYTSINYLINNNHQCDISINLFSYQWQEESKSRPMCQYINWNINFQRSQLFTTEYKCVNIKYAQLKVAQ